MAGVAHVAPIEHVDLGSRVYQLLRRKILTREFRGGDQIHLGELADQMGVSRTPVKDAINRLAHEAFLEIVPRRGTYVVPITGRAVVEVFEVRETFELWAAARGLSTVTPAVLAAMRHAVTEGRRVVTAGGTRAGDDGAFSGQDERFHLLLIQQPGNRRLVEMYKSLGWIPQLIRLYYRRPLQLQMDTQLEHERILHAYETRNPGALTEALHNHLTNGRYRALQLLEENGGAL